ncbi:MAG: site-specific integrase [Bacteroidetes bacterium]|nr:site-specific integrase [Bacteroidota bacterium]
MGQPIKLIIKKGAVRKDGTAVVFIQYCHNAEQRILLNSGIAIPPQYWNKKTGRITGTLPISYGEAEKLQSELTSKLRKAEDMVTNALKKKGTCPMKFLKENFHLQANWKMEQMSTAKKNLDVYWNIDDYVTSKKSTVKRCTINVINMMKSHLKSYEIHRRDPITFDSFDVAFYEGFVKFLTYDIIQARRRDGVRGLKVNSVGKTIKHLKSFLRDRMVKKIIPFMDLSAFKGMEEEVDAVYLNWQELSKIYHLDLSKNRNFEKYRDLFVLGCLTGFRFSDYSDIRPEELRGGMLYVNQAKTLSTVVVPLREDAKRILIDKYNMQMPQVSNPNFNHYIKEVAKLAGIDEMIKITHKRGNRIIEEIRPKYAWVMSHTCRRSFCTNEFLDGTPINLIMAISGHRTEKAFRRYIKADQVQKAQMIKKIWENRPSL